jgi:hypothetical protein
MTICAGMLCTDGIVLCADTMESVGAVHRSVEKLVELPIVSDELKAILVCATSNGIFADGLIERISDSLERSDGMLVSAKKAIERTTREYCKEISDNSDPQQEKPEADFLIGLKTIDDLCLLHISTAMPIVRNVETWEIIGFGVELGIYKAGQYGLKNMPSDTAAPIIAYIVDVVKNNVQYCGRDTSLAILHTNGEVERKSQDYITKTTQGYKSIGWLLDTWVFPFLPLIVAETGEDVLSMIGSLGQPNNDWVEKIPEILKFLYARKQSILAGEIPAIPLNQKNKNAVGGFSLAAQILLNSSKQLYDENLLGKDSYESVNAKYTTVQQLSQVVSAGIDSPEIGPDLIKQSMDRICLLLTSSPPPEQLKLETSEDEQ